MSQSKRTQVLFRAPVQALIEQLSERDRMSASRTVARLVEEALTARGLLQTETVQPLGLELPPGVQAQTVVTNRQAAGQPSPFKQMEDRVLTEAQIHEQVPSLRQEPAPTPVTSQPTEVDADDEVLLQLLLAKKLKEFQKSGRL